MLVEVMIVVLAAIALWAVALPTIRAEREERKTRCGYCAGGTDPNNICESCWTERGLG